MDDYDLAFKKTVERFPQEWLRALLPHWRLRFVRHAPTELVSLTRRIDRILEVRVSGKKRFIHLEAQTRWDRHVPRRMAEYRTRLLFEHDRLVTTVVLVLKRPTRKQRLVSEFVAGRGDDHVSVGFRVVRASDLRFSLRTLRKRPALIPLALLSDATHNNDVEEMADILRGAELPKAKKLDVRVAAAVLGRLRFSGKILEAIVSREMAAEHPWFKEERALGREEGRAALTRVVERLLHQVGAPLDESTQKRVARATLEQLEALADALIEATDEAAAARALTEHLAASG